MQLNDCVNKNSILIVANGPSTKHFKYGNYINQFPVVARINNFVINGFENNIGSKTDVWCNGANQNLDKKENLFDRIIVFIPPEILNRKGPDIHTRIKKRLGIDFNSYDLISEKDMIIFENQSGSKRLTTGTNSILWAMMQYENVVIHGFDFFQNGKEHYFDSGIKSWIFNQKWFKKGSKHNHKQEKKYIIELLNNKKIFELKDLIND
ncbi:MAG: glycosyltransferase family 29 protein [Candidatus Marinimicrobia bacterium]|nr:glycosyltransferase family 29 protein [Candidatus Neomarinimicrobiota bacterium]